ncbi:diguanylate cyclase domain-containing protein [Okeania sp. SIO2B3]|uniref:sensor domain-containing diguanylate cyclase n=1 Tax=Okeania sp. SIO2B3 TaxID=2607784 RepID=UPI0013C28A6E|nr:diguanylate cyclase [Okeania sp. SIO2B3]NET41508.1 diguanylate cyclase [Okeania sp. SIO2B3]
MKKKIPQSISSTISRKIINQIFSLLKLPTIDNVETQLHDKTEQLEQIYAQQKAIYRVISKIRASLDLETIFRTTTKETCRLLGVERVSVYRFNEDWGGEFVGDFEFAEVGWDELEFTDKNTVWNDCYLQKHQGGRYRNNETLIVKDIYKAELSQCHIEILEQFHIRAYATAPIFIKQKLWGILAAYQHSKPHEWETSAVNFLTQIAVQLGFAVQQAEQLAEVEQQAKDLQAASQQQMILFNLISEIRESLDLHTLFKTTAKEVRKALESDRVGIFCFNPESNYCYGEFVSESVLPVYDSALSIKVNDYCFGEQYAIYYQQGRMQVLTDIYNAGLKDCHIEVLEQFQIKAQIIMPLIMGSKLWGLLCIHQCENSREWTPAEIRFVKQLAAQFSVALEHSHLLAQTRLQADELGNTLDALQEANLKLERLARLDGLTQIPNRRYFDEFLDQEWRRMARQKQFLSLIMLDVDYFKLYNDLYGHQEGDTCLIKIAHTAQEVLKCPADLLARYGGEEFAVILSNTDQSRACEVAAQIQSAIKALGIPHPSGKGQIVTISLGVTTQIPSLTRTLHTFIGQADKALYQAKQQGRDCCIHFSMISQDVKSF